MSLVVPCFFQLFLQAAFQFSRRHSQDEEAAVSRINSKYSGTRNHQKRGSF